MVRLHAVYIYKFFSVEISEPLFSDAGISQSASAKMAAASEGHPPVLSTHSTLQTKTKTVTKTNGIFLNTLIKD